jgi:glycosyltransferase involved in cell wall biosynthesis
MPAPLLSVILIARNEAARIEACLASVAFADEWIVVDSASSDDTAERARRLGAQVFDFADWPGFGAQKQRALDRATGHWVLAIDADERVTPELAASIRKAISDEAGPAAYELSRLSRFCGRWIRHGDWYPDRQTRLWQRGQARWIGAEVHETLQADGPVGKLHGDLRHHMADTIDSQIKKISSYSDNFLNDSLARGRGASSFDLFVRPAWRFLRSYFFRLGFLDGWQGGYIAWMTAFYTATRYAKVRAAQMEKSETP